MTSNAKKFIMGIVFLGTCGAGHAQSANDKMASALRDSTNWKEYQAMPPIPAPKRTPYNDNRFRKLINFLHARAMKDSANWQQHQVMPPTQPEKIEKMHMAQNAKTR